MPSNTFGSPEKYSMLIYVSEKIDAMGKNQKEYLSSFINDFNYTYRRIEKLDLDITFKKYLVSTIKADYARRTDELFDKYEYEVVTRIKNFIHAKLCNLIRS